MKDNNEFTEPYPKKTFYIVFLRYTIISLILFLVVYNFDPSQTSQRGFLSKPFVYPRLCGWYSESANETFEDIRGNFSYFREHGIDCVNYQADIPKYPQIAKIAKELDLQIYAWIPAMLGIGSNKQWLYDNHPEVYVITKSGLHAYTDSIYGQAHYKFLCPNHPIVRTFLKEMYDTVSKIPEIDGINLDYIRYIEENLATYDATGDTCYCPYCVSEFYKKSGINLTLEDKPNEINEWNDYRVNVITTLVNEISQIVHKNGKKLSADVYPGPWQSTRQTRRKWDDWDLDMVFPMIYTQVFQRDVSWIGGQTGEGTVDIIAAGRTTKLYTGLQGEAMSDEDFTKGINLSMQNGAYGISVFRLDSVNFELLDNDNFQKINN